MIQRTIPSHTVSRGAGQMNTITYENGKWTDHISPWTAKYPIGQETITYDGPLPAKQEGHCVWKYCSHNSAIKRTWNPAHFKCQVTRRTSPYWTYIWADVDLAPWDQGSVSIPGGSFDRSTLKGVVDQIDLNTRESVLLYSGIIQAVPMLGGVLKLNSILKKAAKKFSKDFRRQPFTTVLQRMISLDFVDRFVVSPTLDDARRFVDSTNYVLRVMQTAYQRNAAPTALSSEATTVVSRTSGSGWHTKSNPSVHYTYEKVQSVTSKAFLHLDVHYDIAAISPIKLWAARVGLSKPLDSVWDLVPFSFVIDYFTRAGDFIAGLSDKMADQEGLRGRVTRIHDCWGTLTRRCVTNYTLDSGSWSYGNGNVTWGPEFTPGTGRVEGKSFTRFQIPNPFEYLDTIQEQNGLFRLDLSPRRIGTLAELWFQAKHR